MYNTSDLGIATVDILQGNIIHLTAKNGVVIDIEAAQMLVRAIDKLLDRSVPTRAGIFEISGVVYVEEEAREYFASGQGTTGTTVGIALVSDSFLGRMVGNMFVTLHPKTKFPVRFFESPIRAEHWIRGLINQHNAAAKEFTSNKRVA
jgi:hypothetical protein